MAPSGTYSGRLVADGNGNLLADEGEHAGLPVAFEDGQFVFVQPGEPSHNARHHENEVGVVITQHQDPEQPGYAGTEDSPTEGHEHHFGPTEDDPHYDPNATNNTNLVQLPDEHARWLSGHTDGYRE